MHRLMVYNKKALWEDVEAWFRGGDPAEATIDLEGATMQKFNKGVRSNWRFYGDHIPKDKRALLNITSYLDVNVTDLATFRVLWEGEFITTRDPKSCSVLTLPEYYKLVKTGKDDVGEWIAVSPEEVPTETGLHDVNFSKPDPRTTLAYVTTEDEEKLFKIQSSFS